MSMEVFVLGCGGSIPLPGRHLTSVLLRREGELFLFDAGEGTQVSLRRLNLKWKKISCIFISHTHADHVTGLPGILMLSSQVDRSEPLYIIGPPRIWEFVESTRRVLEIYLNYEIKVIEISDCKRPQTVFTRDNYTVRSFPLRHTRTCLGYSFSEKPRPGVFNPSAAQELSIPMGPLWAQLQSGNSITLENGRVISPSQVLGPQRSGRKFSFVTDTRPLASIESEVKNSDLLICEGMFEEALSETAAAKGHMTAREAGIIARRAGAKKTGLIHFSPRYNRKELKKLLDEAQKECKNVFLTQDRQIVSIPWQD